MYQGMTEADKAYFAGELQQVADASSEHFNFDYKQSGNWHQNYITINLFWPLISENFSWSSSAIQVWLEDLRDTPYSAEDAGWTVDSVMEFESRVEMLAEKALKESKTYRIEWEEED